MSTLWLSVEVRPGAFIGDACVDAVELANKMGMTVEFKFNGELLHARPGADAEELHRNYLKRTTRT